MIMSWNQECNRQLGNCAAAIIWKLKTRCSSMLHGVSSTQCQISAGILFSWNMSMIILVLWVVGLAVEDPLHVCLLLPDLMLCIERINHLCQCSYVLVFRSGNLLALLAVPHSESITWQECTN